MFFNRKPLLPTLLAGLVALLMVACTPQAEAPPPTRTPAPTFTPTAVNEPAPVDPAALATAQAAAPVAPVAPITDPAAAPAPGSDTGAQPIGGDPAAPITDTAAAPPTVAPTPVPEVKAQLSPTTMVNVRQGPGTTYAVLGQANVGETYDITGKNPAGDWWQIAYRGQSGWVIGELATASNATGVAVAQNIPVAPTPAPVVVAPPTPVPAPPPAEPAPPAEPEPTSPPASNMKFNIVAVSQCLPQPAGNWFEGKTYVNGAPTSGFKVVFSGAGPDGEWATPPVQTGPHAGYEGWDAGFYSHIINASGPQAGTWYVWVVDDGGARISEIASWTSTGPGDGCNQAIVDFDSR